MKHEDACFARDVFDDHFSRPILVMCTYSTNALCLIFALKFQGEVFCGINAIVGVISCDCDTYGSCLPLKSELGMDGFIGGETNLMMDGDVRTGSISKDSSTMIRQSGLRLVMSSLIASIGTGNILIRENMLSWRELIMR